MSTDPHRAPTPADPGHRAGDAHPAAGARPAPPHTCAPATPGAGAAGTPWAAADDQFAGGYAQAARQGGPEAGAEAGAGAWTRAESGADPEAGAATAADARPGAPARTWLPTAPGAGRRDGDDESGGESEGNGQRGRGGQRERGGQRGREGQREGASKSAESSPRPAPRTPAVPWLLMYHSVSHEPDDPYRVTVSPGRLRRQLGWLLDRGLRGVSVAELLRARAAGEAADLVGLTFDDGYADFVDHALPLLREHGCTATVFALPGRIGQYNAWDPLGPRKPLLTEDGLRAAADAGMEIGSHGLLHHRLPAADSHTLRRETAYSRTALQEITGQRVGGFCYPYGAVDRRAVSAVRAAGYDYACAIDPGPLTGPYALPRVHIGESDTAWRLAAKRLLLPLRRRTPFPAPKGERPAPATGTEPATGTVPAAGPVPLTGTVPAAGRPHAAGSNGAPAPTAEAVR
ncbi:polysaccharide deacetylase family protein [Streptomyces sp. 796.1]|uniref:polysaccharide deacetylase family protein n=1 Tax=Streptomyces sp. 796.1 TaxID=3163029 RepID=UPI0039C9C726